MTSFPFKNILLFGSTGMLGTDIRMFFEEKKIRVTSVSKKQCDISNASSVKSLFASLPEHDLIINCAAFTAVDACETDTEKALDSNSKGPLNIVNALLECQSSAYFVHFSTDYIFDGTQPTPYTETAIPNPLNVYGLSKFLGEKAIYSLYPRHYILRVQWLFGRYGTHFISTMKRLLSEKSEISVVCDQWGAPTHCRDIAVCLFDFLQRSPEAGAYHLSSQGSTTWYDYAVFIRDSLGLSCSILPQSTDTYKFRAKRPLNSCFDLSKWTLTGAKIPNHWKKCVENFLV